MGVACHALSISRLPRHATARVEFELCLLHRRAAGFRSLCGAFGWSGIQHWTTRSEGSRRQGRESALMTVQTVVEGGKEGGGGRGGGGGGFNVIVSMRDVDTFISTSVVINHSTYIMQY